MKCDRCGKDNPAEAHTCSIPLALALADALQDEDMLEYDLQLCAAAELRKQYEEIVRLTEALHMEETISFRRQLHEVQAEIEATERQVEILSDELSKCGKVNEALRAELERVAPGYAALARAGGKE